MATIVRFFVVVSIIVAVATSASAQFPGPDPELVKQLREWRTAKADSVSLILMAGGGPIVVDTVRVSATAWNRADKPLEVRLPTGFFQRMTLFAPAGGTVRRITSDGGSISTSAIWGYRLDLTQKKEIIEIRPPKKK